MDISAAPPRPEPIAVPVVHFCISTTKQRTQRKTAQKQRAIPLFSRSPNRWWPRISAENAIAPADNFAQKQQKQQNNENYRPSAHAGSGIG
jgi:hypothetical protein